MNNLPFAMASNLSEDTFLVYRSTVCIPSVAFSQPPTAINGANRYSTWHQIDPENLIAPIYESGFRIVISDNHFFRMDGIPQLYG